MRTLLILPLVWLLAATPAAMPAAAATLDEILERGTLRVGMALTTPWAMRDADGALIGFEADVAAQLARDLGVELQAETMAFDELIPALEEGAIDLIASGLSVTPRRALRLAYSRPYATSGISILINRELADGVAKLSDLNDPNARIAVVRDTTAADLARSQFPDAEIFLLATEEEVGTAVLTGRVLAAVAATPFPELRELAHPDKLLEPVDEPLVQTAEAFGFAHGAPKLENALNAWIVFRTLDGWLAERRNFWFGTLAWQDQLPPGERIVTPGQ
jgi:polar amino acid transport system substrate-binding protein